MLSRHTNPCRSPIRAVRAVVYYDQACAHMPQHRDVLALVNIIEY